MKIIHLICAARPNFMKIAPLYKALKEESWCQANIVHTGQHYDYIMSETFFEEFKLPAPHFYLGVGSGSHAEQTAQTMIAYETLCLTQSKPDLIIVVGDVNATLACAITGKKLNLTVAHLEAGLRSHDRLMPEEINRIVTDSISDYFLTPSEDADLNLLKEGIPLEKIYCVGNIMIDTYFNMKKEIEKKNFYRTLELDQNKFIVLTLHRPSNVDHPDKLTSLLNVIDSLNKTVIFPAHPRTQKNLEKITFKPKNIRIIDPLSYTNFMNLVSHSYAVISDSGGVQEETTYLQIPCFTLRDSTERPVTITLGSNQLVSKETLTTVFQNPKTGTTPPLWDGQTAKRIVFFLKRVLL